MPLINKGSFLEITTKFIFIKKCIDRYEDILLEPVLEKDEIYLHVVYLGV